MGNAHLAIVAMETPIERHRSHWQDFVTRLRHALESLGLREGIDYWFHDQHESDQSNLIEFDGRDKMTAELLLACDKVVRNEQDWSVIMAISGPPSGRLQPLVQTNGEMFTSLSKDLEIRKIIYEALQRRGDNWLRYVRPPVDKMRSPPLINSSPIALLQVPVANAKFLLANS